MAHAGGSTLKEVTMELGGKSPLIVFDDANIERAADIAMSANFFSSEQVCTNGTRVFVQRGVIERFEKLVLERVKRIRIGAPDDPNTNFGSLASAAQLEKVLGFIESGKREGARRAARVSPMARSRAANTSRPPCSPIAVTTCASCVKRSSVRS